MNIKEISGKRIAEARDKLGLTQRELAELVPGLSPSRLGNYEQGGRYAPPEILLGLAKVLNEPASYLAALDSDPGLIALERKYVKMDQRGKDTLHRVAESQPAPFETGTTKETGS
tara:strand:+ start:75 stop:419 length:345 start_codon:yes stop_codon:yes gene_type:complete